MKANMYIRSGLWSIALALAVPASSAIAQDTVRSDPRPVAGAQRGERGDASEDLREASILIQKIKSQPELADLMQRSKAVFLVPDYGRGGFVVAGQGGDGVLLARTGASEWSAPLFYNIGGISIGLQAGAEGGSVAMFLMTERALNSFKQQNNFSLNADAGLTIINYSARAQGSLGKGDVVIWSDAKGAYAGVSLGVSDIFWDGDETRAYYGKTVTPAAVINGQVQAPASAELDDALRGQ